MATCSTVLAQWLASNSQVLVSPEEDALILQWVAEQKELIGDEWYVASDEQAADMLAHYDLHGKRLAHFYENNWSEELLEHTDRAGNCYPEVVLSENRKLCFLQIDMLRGDSSIYVLPSNALSLLSM